MAANVERLTSAQNFIDRSMEVIRRQALIRDETRTVVDLSRIDPSLPADFVIFELLRGFGFNGEVINSLYRAFCEGHGSGQAFLFERQRSLHRPRSHPDHPRSPTTRAARRK